MKGKTCASAVRLFVVVIIAAVMSVPCNVRADSTDDLKDAGDVLQFLLPGLAIGSTFIAGDSEGNLWDREGTEQAVKSIGTSLLTTTVWKGAAGKLRPDGNDRTSFPSGHTTAAFSGASFIGSRYGWKWGIPAYAAAGVTAFSRVESEAHFADDVTAGASIALMSNFYFVTPQSRDRQVAVLPMSIGDGFGLQLAMAADLDSGNIPHVNSERSSLAKRRFRFNFAFGPAFLYKNEVTASTDDGTTFDLNNFDKEDNPTTTAAIDFSFYLGDRHEIVLYWNPFEARDTGSFNSPVRFGNDIFPANREIRSTWRLYEVRGRWLYNLTPESRWNIKAGGGAFVQWLDVELKTRSGEPKIEETVGDNVILPMLSGYAGYNFTPRWSAGVEADGISTSDDYMLDLVVSVNYRISDQWDVTAGYEYYNREIDTSDLTNKVIYNVPYFALAYSWL